MKRKKRDKSPFEEVLSQIEDLMQLVDEKQTQSPTKKLPDNIENQLDELEKNMAAFKEITNQMLEKAKVDPKSVQENIRDPKHLSPEEQAILKRASKMKELVDKKRRLYTRQAKLIEKAQKEEGKGKGKKKSIQAHKKKFKRMGGKKDWKPL